MKNTSPFGIAFVTICPSLLLLIQHPSDNILWSSVVVDKTSLDKLLDDVKDTDVDEDSSDLTGEPDLFGTTIGAIGRVYTCTGLSSGSHCTLDELIKNFFIMKNNISNF